MTGTLVRPSPTLDVPVGQPAPERLARVVEQFGSNADSFQALASHHRRLCFDDLGLVALKRIGRFTVVAGDPVAPPGHLIELVTALRRTLPGPVALVSASAPVRDELAAHGWGWIKVGEEPYWGPERWSLDGKAIGRVRHAVKSALGKGLTVARASHGTETWARDLADMREVADRWARSHDIRQLGFLLTLAPFELPERRRYFLARDAEGRCLAFLAAVPIHARGGWYFQDLVRDPEAPNGTVELVFHEAMRALGSEGARMVTMGAAPLAGLEKETPQLAWLNRVLRFAYERLDAFYGFQSLTEAKAKFVPHWWEAKYLVFTPRRMRARLLFSVLKAYDDRGVSGMVLSKLGRALKDELAADPDTGRPRIVDQALAVPGLLLSQDLVVAAGLALGIGTVIGIVADHLRRSFDDLHVALAASLPAAMLTVAVLRAKDRFEEQQKP
jgi:phosphatidylglycerol lysyltransferase